MGLEQPRRARSVIGSLRSRCLRVSWHATQL
jgi:hypothetical protein